MREMLAPTAALIGKGFGETVGLITDGRFSGGTQPVGLKESKRKLTWARADFSAFQANGCSIGVGKRENMHRPGQFAADFL